MQDIPIVQDATFEMIAHATRNFDRPALIKGSMDDWPCHVRWNDPYLISTVGDVICKVSVSSDGIFRGDPQKGFTDTTIAMPMTQFLLESQKDTKNLLYLQQASLLGEFRALRDDVRTPGFLDAHTFQAINLWMGHQGNVTPLHFDTSHNALCQVRGTKRVTLYSPINTHYLYPYSMETRIPHMSMVDIRNPDPQKFPLFERAKPLSCELTDGDILFIPYSWWHHVETVDDSISVNFWWRPAYLK